MKMICNRLELLEALQGVAKAVSGKSTIPALEGILFKCGGYAVTLTAYDLELGITTTISAEIEDPLDLVVPKTFSEMVRKMESDTVTMNVTGDLRIELRGGNSQFVIMGLPAADYPELAFPDTDNRVKLKCLTVKEMIAKTIYAVSTNDQKPVHTGTKFLFGDDSLTLISVDGYRLALCSRTGTGVSSDATFVVPAKTLAEVSRLVGDADEEVEIATEKRYAIFHLPHYTILTRLLEGDFLDHTKSIPNGYKTRVRVGTQTIYDAVERAALIISDRFKSPVRLKFQDSQVDVSCSTPLGNSRDILNCEIEGDELEIGFNNKYLLDALRYSGCDEILIELNGPLSPIKILPGDASGSFLFLVVPIRIKSND